MNPKLRANIIKTVADSVLKEANELALEKEIGPFCYQLFGRDHCEVLFLYKHAEIVITMIMPHSDFLFGSGQNYTWYGLYRCGNSPTIIELNGSVIFRLLVAEEALTRKSPQKINGLYEGKDGVRVKAEVWKRLVDEGVIDRAALWGLPQKVMAIPPYPEYKGQVLLSYPNYWVDVDDVEIIE